MGFLEVLTLIFVVLKLLGKIDWSWWVVLSPVIGATILYLGIAAAVFWKYLRK